MVRICFLLLLWSGQLAASTPPTIMVLGDSLSSAYGLNYEQGWVVLLGDRLADRDYPHRVVNASISGDTTTNALSRLRPALDQHDPEIVVVELGGNDGLRAQPVAVIRKNMVDILSAIRERGAKIVLAGIRLPPNYGPAYNSAFENMYPALAQRFEAVLVPFFMHGVATKPEMMQADGIHPNEAAQRVLLDNVWPQLEPLLNGGD